MEPFSGMQKKEIKVAVTKGMKEQNNIPAFLGHLNFAVEDPLSSFIQALCKHFQLQHPEDYGLQYIDPPHHYISENNSERLKDGVLLALVTSVSRLCEGIVKGLLQGDAQQKGAALTILSNHSSDPLLSHEFIKLQGMVFLVNGIEEDRFSTEQLGYALTAFLNIMEHSIVTWDIIKNQFIKKITSFINVQSQSDCVVLETSLLILESLALNQTEHYNLIESMVTLPHLLQHIANFKATSDNQNASSSQKRRKVHAQDIQQCVLALVNALYSKTDARKQNYFFSTLTSRQYRNIILEFVLNKEVTELHSELRHQLYVLQQLILNNYSDRMHCAVDPNDDSVNAVIMELKTLAFDDCRDITTVNNDVTHRRNIDLKELRKLGFDDDKNPANDFKQVPPGALALDHLHYFARVHSDQYSKLVMENCYRADSHECPLGKASIEVTKMLCEILRIGEQPLEKEQSFYPLLFSHDHSFEEIFSICLVIFNKTWKEMKATTDDFTKVVSVVRVQITRTLNENCRSLDQLQESIYKFDYSRVSKIWEEELRKNEEKEMQAPPIIELKNRIRDEMMELVQQHRLNFLVDGTRFQIKSRSSKEKKFHYWRLSGNHKFLHYGACAESSTPTIEELTEKINATEIKDIVTGKECQLRKENRRAMYPFCLLLEDNRTLDFDAPNDQIFQYWQDGINVLLRRPMNSERTKRDLETLVNMELKLRLLDIEGIHIPQSAPPIPAPPPNYNFYQIN